MSHKTVAYKSVAQKCPAKVFHASALREFSTRASPTRARALSSTRAPRKSALLMVSSPVSFPKVFSHPFQPCNLERILHSEEGAKEVYCGKVSWATHSCGLLLYAHCRGHLWDTLVASLRDTLVGHALVGNSCKTKLCDTLGMVL